MITPATFTPEFVSVRDAVKLFGIGQSSLYALMTSGTVQSHLIRKPGNQSGRRLVSTTSLRAYVTGHDAGTFTTQPTP